MGSVGEDWGELSRGLLMKGLTNPKLNLVFILRVWKSHHRIFRLLHDEFCVLGVFLLASERMK